MKTIKFFKRIGKLKNIKRTGWVNFKVPNPESVAEHSFRTAIMAMILAPKVGADVNKSVKMALIHDTGESKIGDIVTMYGKKQIGNISDKVAKERKAIKELYSLVDGNEYIKLFDEYEAKKTKEAKLVKEIDKLEMAMQAYEYEETHKMDLEVFFESCDALVTSREMKEVLRKIEKLRRK